MDLDPSSVTSGGWLEDTSLVEKYKISDEAYEKRDGKFSKTLIICKNHILIILFCIDFKLVMFLLGPWPIFGTC